MMCSAILTTDSKDPAAVSGSLSGDDASMESLRVTTVSSDGAVVCTVEAESLSTLLSTIDDLLRCQMTSESLI